MTSALAFGNEKVEQFLRNPSQSEIRRTLFGNNGEGDRRRERLNIQPEKFAQDAFGSVPLHGSAYLSAYG